MYQNRRQNSDWDSDRAWDDKWESFIPQIIVIAFDAKFSLEQLDDRLLVNLKFQSINFMQTIRWIRIILSTVFILLGLAFGTYFYIKEHSPAIAIFDGCAVVFAPAGSSENIPFGDLRCPK